MRAPDNTWDAKLGKRAATAARWTAALTLVFALASCLKIDRTGAELKTAQAEWRSRIEALRGRETEIEVQLHAAQGRLPDDSMWGVAMRRRLDAAIVGEQQGLADLDREVDRLALEVNAAKDREAALEEVRTRITGYFNVQQDNLVSMQQEVTLADRGEPKAEQAALTNGVDK